MVKIDKAKSEATRQALDSAISIWLSGLSGSYKNYMDNVPLAYRKLTYRVYAQKKTGKDLVKLKCLDCAGFVREEVEKCTVETCPIWQQRPYQK